MGRGTIPRPFKREEHHVPLLMRRGTIAALAAIPSTRGSDVYYPIKAGRLEIVVSYLVDGISDAFTQLVK